MNPLRSGFLFIELNARSALSAALSARDLAPDLLFPKSQDILFEREAPWMFNGNGATNDPDLGHWRVKVWRHGLLNDQGNEFDSEYLSEKPERLGPLSLSCARNDCHPETLGALGAAQELLALNQTVSGASSSDAPGSTGPKPRAL